MAYTTIKKPSLHMNAKIYTGNGSTQSITGVGFQPDLVWGKNRSTTDSHSLYDAVRGVTKRLKSDSAGAETTQSNGVTAFGTDGFTVGDHGGVNGNGNNIASWNWKANGAGSANTDGSITSTVSANTTAGFSISSFTGTGANATFGHGLGAVPKMYILKRYDSSNNWRVYHESIGNGKYMTLETTEAEQTSSGFTNNTSPTSSLISLGNLGSANPSGGSVICYAFAEKQGYSKFGSFTSNTSTNDSFIYLGFKPNFFLVKSTTNTNAWIMFDGARNKSNPTNAKLYPNSSAVEDTEPDFDFLSNGVKLRANFGANTFIYMAFAEQPLVGDNPATAR